MTTGVHNPVGSVKINGAPVTAKKFSLESTLELPADHYAITTPDTSIFRNALPTDTASVSAGLRDASGATTVTISALTDGPVDEYQLVITPTSIVQTLRGRDASALILDRYYQDPNDPANADVKLFARTAQIFPGATQEVLVTSIPPSLVNALNIGRHTASSIAATVVASVGLQLSWEVLDYELLQERFIASGRIIDVLRRLTAPWNQVDPFKVDIFIQNDTVIVRHRNPIIPLATADYTFDLTALRRSTLTVRKRRLRKIGRVQLQGGVASTIMRSGKRAGDGTNTSGGIETVTLESTSFDKAGNITSKTITEERYRVPDRILLGSLKSTFTGGAGVPLKLTIRETVENEWEDSIYDANGNAVNSPKQTAQTIAREGIDPSDTNKLFRHIGEEATQYEYDDNGFLQHHTTTTRKFTLSTGQMDYDKLTSKLLHDIGPLWIEEIVEQFSYDTFAQQWNLFQRDTSVSAGHRPGGPGRGVSRAGVRNGQLRPDTVSIDAVISTDADAVPVSFSDPNMTLEDLQYIFGMFQAASGAIEFELSFQGVGMGWMKRGQTIQFFDIRDENGVEITLPIVTVTEVKTDFDESTPSAQYIMSCRAFGWITSVPTGVGAQSTPLALVSTP